MSLPTPNKDPAGPVTLGLEERVRHQSGFLYLRNTESKL